MRKTWIILAILVAFSLVSTVGAMPFSLSQTGTLHIKFISSSADYHDHFGIKSPWVQSLGVNHPTPTPPNDEWTHAYVGGSPIVLTLFVQETGNTWSSLPSENSDTSEHITKTPSGDAVLIGWEDLTLPRTGGEPDYNDVILKLWVVPSILTPEFPTMALPAALIVGMLGVVLFIQRSKEN